VTGFDIGPDRPDAPDVIRLLQEHLRHARAWSRPEDMHALEVDALLGADILFYSARSPGRLLAVGALRRIDVGHAEIKSMHVEEQARGQGTGKAMLDHLVACAREHGFARLSLETGMQDAFLPARRLYLNAGFVACAPFGSYQVSGDSVCMTRALDREESGGCS
jgi:putative acetyltransferase